MMPADLLYGMDAVAEHLSLTKRQALHLHEKGKLPTFKLGRTVCATRSSIAAHFAKLESEARHGAAR